MPPQEEGRKNGPGGRRRRIGAHAMHKQNARYASLAFFPTCTAHCRAKRREGAGRDPSIIQPASQPASLFGSSNFASGLRYPHTSLSLPLASAGLLCWLGWQQHPQHSTGTALRYTMESKFLFPCSKERIHMSRICVTSDWLPTPSCYSAN